MFLSAPNLAHYLLSRGRISLDSVVGGDFQVFEAGRRNRNFKVLRRSGTGIFVKQIGTFDQGAIGTLRREAACYQFVRGKPEFEPLAALMPELVDYDPVRHVLMLELLPEGENLTEYHIRERAFPTEVGRMLGEGLGAYHSELGNLVGEQTEVTTFPRMTPWIMSLHRGSAETTGQLSGGNSQMVNVIRQFPDFQQMLDETREMWRFDSLIHGDIKWDNCLIVTREEAPPEFKIIDWELADIGDARWDSGAVFQSYLSYWVFQMMVAPGIDLAQSVAGAPYKLKDVQPAMQEFWRSYSSKRGLDGAVADRELALCLRFCAARMIQTVYEMMHRQTALSNHAIIILQLSMNILSDPERAVSEVLGF